MRISDWSSDVCSSDLRELAFIYADIADLPVSALRWDEVVIDRTNRGCQELFAMARLFLQDRYQTTTGGSGRGISMLFEMNTLFEDYVGRQVARALVGPGFTVSLQSGRLFCLSADDGRGLFQTKPDILIRRARSEEHTSELQSLMRLSY